MELKVCDPTNRLPYAQMGVSKQKLEYIFTVLEPRIEHHIDFCTPRAVVLQEIAHHCDTLEELLAILDVYYSYLHKHDEMYPH